MYNTLTELFFVCGSSLSDYILGGGGGVPSKSWARISAKERSISYGTWQQWHDTMSELCDNAAYLILEVIVPVAISLFTKS